MQIGKFDLEKDGVFIIAELSANHANSLQIAKDTIYAAKESGANAIKLQTYTPEWMTIDCDKEDFIINDETLWDGRNYFDLYRWAMTPLEWHQELFSYARSLDLEIFSTPFSKEAVDFLETLNPPAYKIASFEITDYALIQYAASKQKPLIVSTGIASIDEIFDVVSIAENYGVDLALLKCTSAYPAPLEDMHLRTIANMKETFGVTVGFSDHTLGTTAPVIATALGAQIIEKHFILDKNIDSPDKAFSLDPTEFKAMTQAVRDTQKMLGEIHYKPKKGRNFSRSLYIVEDVKAGEVVTEENVRAIRPGFGMHPKFLPQVLGKKFRNDYEKGTRLTWELIES